MFGLGSQAHPCWGDFDYIIDNGAVDFHNVVLGPGCFFTRGCYDRTSPLGGQTFKGDPAGTTLVLTNQTTGTCVLWSDEDQITVNNLAINSDPNANTTYTATGVLLKGNSNTVSGVTVRHVTGWYASGGEGFAFLIGLWEKSANTVSGCTVSGSRGDYNGVDGIGFMGGGVVQNNTVNMTAGCGMCINSAWANSATYVSNNCTGGWVGFYNDTAGNTNVTLENNNFVGMTQVLPGGAAAYGLCMGVAGTSFQGITNLVISGNLFKPSGDPPSYGIAIANDRARLGPQIQNVTITNNTVQFDGGTSGECVALHLCTTNWDQSFPPYYFGNCYIGYNYIQTNVQQHVVGIELHMQQWTVDHNMDLSGGYLCPPCWPTNGTLTTYTKFYFEYP